MATTGGANITVDGLVFGYDTGYPLVSGSSDTYKFNKGEPTENLITQMAGTTDIAYPQTVYRSTAIETNVSNPSAPHGVYSRFTGIDSSSNNQLYSTFNSAGIDVRNTTITYSVSLKGSGTCHLTIYADNAGYGTSSTITLTNEWTRYTYTRAVTNYTTNCWVAVRGVLNTTDVYIAAQQAEINSHPTPFTTGTRSVSGSLIDLTRTSNIDLSNVSFDSNAQMTFDGTDDIIELDVDDWIRTKSVMSFEGVFYLSAETYGAPWGILTATSPLGDSDGFWWHVRYPALSNALLYRVEDSGGEHAYNRTELFQFNKWYHVVTVVGSDMIKIYRDGELLTSSTPTFQWSNINSDTAILTVGKSWSSRITGNIPIFKLFDRELTAQEVLQNYNAVKERFSL